MTEIVLIVGNAFLLWMCLWVYRIWNQVYKKQGDFYARVTKTHPVVDWIYKIRVPDFAYLPWLSGVGIIDSSCFPHSRLARVGHRGQAKICERKIRGLPLRDPHEFSKELLKTRAPLAMRDAPDASHPD